jgi:hypothetical protein
MRRRSSSSSSSSSNSSRKLSLLKYIKLIEEQADGTTNSLFNKTVSYFVDNQTIIKLIIV